MNTKNHRNEYKYTKAMAFVCGIVFIVMLPQTINSLRQLVLLKWTIASIAASDAHKDLQKGNCVTILQAGQGKEKLIERDVASHNSIITTILDEKEPYSIPPEYIWFISHKKISMIYLEAYNKYIIDNISGLNP